MFVSDVLLPSPLSEGYGITLGCDPLLQSCPPSGSRA